jgi:hypothetical protein
MGWCLVRQVGRNERRGRGGRGGGGGESEEENSGEEGDDKEHPPLNHARREPQQAFQSKAPHSCRALPCSTRLSSFVVSAFLSSPNLTTRGSISHTTGPSWKESH